MPRLFLSALLLASYSVASHAATYSYSNKIEGDKVIALTVIIDGSLSASPQAGTCAQEIPEQYNDRTNEFTPARTIQLPCGKLHFDNQIKIKASLLDEKTKQTETVELSQNIQITGEANQALKSDVQNFMMLHWDILFPSMGYGIRVGNSSRWLQVVAHQGPDGTYTLPINFDEILNYSQGMEPFWCAKYDATATGAWYQLNLGGDPTLSPYRNSKVCGTFKFAGN